MSAPTDTKANTFPSLPLHALTCVRKRTRFTFRTHSLLGPQNLPTLAHKRTRTRPSPFLHIHAMPPCVVRRKDRAATSSCRTAGSRVLLRPSEPLATSAPQFAVQQAGRRGQAGRQRRGGQRRQHHLLASGRGAPRHRLASPHPTRPTPPRRPPPPRPSDSARASPTASPTASTTPPPALCLPYSSTAAPSTAAALEPCSSAGAVVSSLFFSTRRRPFLLLPSAPSWHPSSRYRACRSHREC